MLIASEPPLGQNIIALERLFVNSLVVLRTTPLHPTARDCGFSGAKFYKIHLVKGEHPVFGGAFNIRCKIHKEYFSIDILKYSKI